MLRILRGGQRWLTAIFIIAVGGVFVLFLGLQGPMTGRGATTLVRVGPYDFGLREFEQTRARREALVQEELGDAYDSRALGETLDNLAARELVEEALLALSAEDMGLTVTKREVEQLVLRQPAFRGEGGAFDREAFKRYAEYEYGSQQAFLESQRRRMLALKMVRVIRSQPEVSEGEARDAVRRQLEKARIAVVVLTPEPPEDTEIAPEEIQSALEARAGEVASLYDELSSRYNRPERVRARHILRTARKDAPEGEVEQARAVIEEALERVRAGDDFAQVARELSQDPGSQPSGGDLGFFARGQMVPAFEEAAFALQPGETSEVVRSDFGFHIIQVEEREEAVSRSFEEVREEVAEELLRREAGERAARETAEILADAVRAGRTLEESASELGLETTRSGWISRGPRGVVPGLGAAPELVASAFALEPGESSPRIFEVGNRLALVQLLERDAPDEETVSAQVEAKQQELLEGKRNLRLAAWVDARRQPLVASGELVVNLDALR